MSKSIKRAFGILAIVLLLGCMLTACAEVSPVETKPSNQLNPDLPAEFLGFETVFACTETGMIGGDKYDDLYESRVLVFYLRERLTNAMYVWRTSGRQSSNNGYSYWSSGMTALMDPATSGVMTYEAFLQYIQNARILCPECNKEFESPVSYCPDCGSAVCVMEGENNGE